MAAPVEPEGYDAGTEVKKLGVLACRGCKAYRVIRPALLCCCRACDVSQGEEHDDECMQMPLFPSRTPRSVVTPFAQRLRDLVEDHGPVSIHNLEHFWNQKYGDGSWSNERPVKSPKKACQKPYSALTLVVNDVVYAIEADGEPFQKELVEEDDRLFLSLTAGVVQDLHDEYKDATTGQRQVKVSFRNEDDGSWEAILRLLGVTSSRGDVLQKETKVSAYGKRPESAWSVAKLRLLQELGRWTNDGNSVSVLRLEEGKDLLRALQEQIEAEVTGALNSGSAASTGSSTRIQVALRKVRAKAQDLASKICELLQAPPPCRANCWTFLCQAWELLLQIQDSQWTEEVLRPVMQAMAAAPESFAAALKSWSDLGLVTMWRTCDNPSLFDPLEGLKAIRIEQESVEAHYVRQNLLGLFREQRMQLTEEIGKCSGEMRTVSVGWKLKQGQWHLSFDASQVPLSFGWKGTALLLVSRGSPGGRAVAEALDDGKAVLRFGVPSIEDYFNVLTSSELDIRVLASYATVFDRQLEALHGLLSSKSPYHASIRAALIGSWKLNMPPDALSRATVAAAAAAASDDDPMANEIEEWQKCASEVPRSMISGVRRPNVCKAPKALTDKQQAAVTNAMTRRVSLVRGPPGTGKTYVAAAIAANVLPMLQESQRVLCVCQTHVAAINILKRLESFNVRAVRVGTTLKPAEIVEQDFFSKYEELNRDVEQVKKIRQLAMMNREEMRGGRGGGFGGDEFNPKEVKEVMMFVMTALLQTADVVVTTNATSGNRGLIRGRFPFLIIDEAAVLCEPAPLVPLVLGCGAVAFVGDEKQLPSVVLDRVAEQEGFGISMFERCVMQGIVTPGNGFVQLDEQRRMHPSIADFPAKKFYDEGLHSHVQTKGRRQMRGFRWPNESCRVCFVDCGRGFIEGGRGQSWSNEAEAEALMKVLSRLLRHGVKPHQIGVITGYSAQQELLKRRIKSECYQPFIETLRVDTIDGFQGAERDIILASTVRSSKHGNVGFMSNPRRINVLLTRARRGLIVFGDRSTLEKEEVTWRDWVRWVEQQGSIVNSHYLQMEPPMLPESPPSSPRVDEGEVEEWDGAEDQSPAQAARSGQAFLSEEDRMDPGEADRRVRPRNVDLEAESEQTQQEPNRAEAASAASMDEEGSASAPESDYHWFFRGKVYTHQFLNAETGQTWLWNEATEDWIYEEDDDKATPFFLKDGPPAS